MAEAIGPRPQFTRPGGPRCVHKKVALGASRSGAWLGGEMLYISETFF